MKNFNLENWREKYKNKEIKPKEIQNIIKPGSRIFIGSACSEPKLLTRFLLQNKEWTLPDVQFLHFFSLSESKIYSEDKPSRFRHNTLSIIGSKRIRKAINEGKSDYTPINSSEIPKMLRGRRYKIDIALIQVSLPDKNGFCSLGINVDINRTIVDVAGLVVAEINPNMPRTMGNSFIQFEDIDHYVYCNEPLLEYKIPPPDKSIEKISEYVSRLIENGSTLNLGFGKITDAIPQYLIRSKKKDLAIYSEILQESIIPLIEQGHVNCSKNYFPHCMTSFILGTQKFYEYVDNNPFIEFHSIDYLSNIENLAKNNKLCSVYGAVAVDLFGQTTNHIGIELYSGIGGEAEFIHASSLTQQGKSIIALKSIANDGESRILPILPSGIIALRSFDVHYVVTEWGIAHLYGKSLRERVLQMIGVAHPKFRSDLLKHAKEMNYVYPDQEIPTTQDGVVVICPDWDWTYKTKTKGKIHFSAVKPTDERLLQDLYYSLSKEDRIMRFFSPQKIFSHEETQSRIMCDYSTSMVLVGFTGRKEEDQRIIAVGAYYLEPNTNLVEISITIHEEFRNQGLAHYIMDRLIEIAEEKGFDGICGDVYVNNLPMLQILNSLPFDVVFTRNEDDDETLEFHFYFQTKRDRKLTQDQYMIP